LKKASNIRWLIFKSTNKYSNNGKLRLTNFIFEIMLITKDQNELLKLLSPLIESYLAEMKISSSVEEYVRELAILPIKIEGKLIGFWGVSYRKKGKIFLATLKACYLMREYRGRYLNRAADDFFRGMEKQGVTNLEVWNHYNVQRWFERRYSLKPQIFVTHGKLEQFKIKN